MFFSRSDLDPSKRWTNLAQLNPGAQADRTMSGVLFAIVLAFTSLGVATSSTMTSVDGYGPGRILHASMKGVAWGDSENGGDSSSVDLSTGVEFAMCGLACVVVKTDGSAVKV